MEIPVLNRITELVGDLSSLPNVNIYFQIFPAFPGLEKFSPSLRFWKWSALIIALLATFSGIINRVKILIINFKRKPSPISEPFCKFLEEREDGGSGTDNLGSSEDENEDEPPSTSGNREPENESDFCVKGSGRSSDCRSFRRYSGLRRRHCTGEVNRDLFTPACFSSGGCIVKQWENGISVYDTNKEQEVRTIFDGETQVESATLSPPVMMLSSGKGSSGNVSVRLWDTRAGSRRPAVVAKWKPTSGNVVEVMAAGIMVGDIRKVWSESVNSTECGVDGWWDIDAVMMRESWLLDRVEEVTVKGTWVAHL